MKEIKRQIDTLVPLAKRLAATHSVYDKLAILDRETYSVSPILSTYLQGLNPECTLVIKSLMAIGQVETVFAGLEELLEPFDALRRLVSMLLPVEKFYDVIGGIVGYQLSILKLVHSKTEPSESGHNNLEYSKAMGEDISRLSASVHHDIRWGLETLPNCAEIYPVGGAGDRLDLHDEKTYTPLPAAQLLFCGRTLLEGMVRDVQAREYLYEKLFEKKVVTPIVLMTSNEKNNHHLVETICEDQEWFGRSKEKFFFFTQPLVPVVTVEGDWVMTGPLTVMTKPGGHGAIWKLAVDSGAFAWLKEQKRTKVLVRQINNPVAGVDYGVTAFMGYGCYKEKSFGFASCQRLLNTAEGMDVLVEEKVDQGYKYHIANIEYTDFKLHGIDDVPETPGSPYSAYPTNTNILFADLSTVEKAAKHNPIPGMLINMKTKIDKPDGTQVVAGRLESMMQSIADEIVDLFSRKIESSQHKELKTFLTYNTREKTISTTKKSYQEGRSIVETPLGCYYDVLLNAHDLLQHHCGMAVPDVSDQEDFVRVSPSFVCLYHPALGPMYHIIAQKIRGGSLAENGELQLEIAELDMKECVIKGSLLITADIFGGRCHMHDVRIDNLGIDREAENVYWQNRISRKEACEIVLHGESEFYAENITLKGGQKIEVPHQHRVIAHEVDGRIHFRVEKIGLPTWKWAYSFDDNDAIILEKKVNKLEQVG